MLKYLATFLMLGAFLFTTVGCESDGRVDDDGARLEVDVDN